MSKIEKLKANLPETPVAQETAAEEKIDSMLDADRNDAAKDAVADASAQTVNAETEIKTENNGEELAENETAAAKEVTPEKSEPEMAEDKTAQTENTENEQSDVAKTAEAEKIADEKSADTNDVSGENAEAAKTAEVNGTDAENASEETQSVHIINVKKLSKMLTAGAACVIVAGVVALMGLANGGVKNLSADDSEDSSYLAQTDAKNDSLSVPATMSWWMAGITENDIVWDDEESEPVTSQVSQTEKTTETTTTTAEQTTEAETTTTTTAPVTTTESVITTTQKKTEYTAEKIEAKVFYLTDNVNLRKGAGTNYDKITTLKKGTAVTAVEKCSNGWYKVTVGELGGYIIDDYLTSEKPVTTTTTTKVTTTTTTTVTTTAKPAETTKPAEQEKAPTTTADKPVISYSDEELQMFYYVVEGEAGGCSEQAKLAVANVIINRVKSPRFANSLSGVLTARGQFTAINNYYNKYRKPTSSTKDCVNRALYGEDNSNGAVYFYAPRYCSGSTAAWFESLTFCFEVDGQRFFK